jgi:cytochrome c-type biogenesis protein CcmH
VKRFLAIVLVACAVASSGAAFAIDPLPFRNTAERERFQHLTRQLRCMVCQNESLDSSSADLAQQLRRQIFDMMQHGKTDAQIKQYLAARYSDFILYDPPMKPDTLLLWFGPAALLLAGGTVVAVLLRRRTRPADAVPGEPGDDW